MQDEVIIVGAFHEIVELCALCGIHIAGIIDNEKQRVFRVYEILGKDSDAPEIFKKYKKTPIIISPDKPEIRKKLTIYYSKIGFTFTNIISPYAIVSKSADIGKGVIVQSNVNISSKVKLGNFCKINSCANIMHDTIIGDFTTIAPNAVILGRVVIGNNCYIGANSTILPEKKIGNNAIVGAGAVVTKNIEPFTIYAGNPAKKLKQFNDLKEMENYLYYK